MSQETLDAARLRLLLVDGDLFSAGRCRYAGDQTHIVGEIHGPRTYGGFVAAVGAEYVPDEGQTYVAWVVVPGEAFAASVVDEFGIRRLAVA